MVAEYNFCKITVYDSGIVIFSGSIHKLYNAIKGIVSPNYKGNGLYSKYNGFNGNLFTLDDIITVRKHLCWLFGCSPAQMIIRNIEFGFNVVIGFDPKLFITGLLYHKNKLFEFRFHRHFARVEHQHFELKIYNKSNQYGLVNHTIRCEIKFNKMLEIKRLGIESFADINSRKIENVVALFLHRFDEVVYYDNTVFTHGLSRPQMKSLERYSNPRYWIDELKPNQRDRHKKSLNKIIQENSKNLHQLIRNEIVKKCSIITRLSKTENVA
ncbi:MAG: hypothetical protein JW717_04315 [Marinilabiliaceae bacterium]|nr:hypothetical protein [Marinilabiliaceae bacterium]MBN2819092.1 hypothetical protein [Bacteroidales bacterium]